MLEQMVAHPERLNMQVAFPSEQTCCGQPVYNSGFQSLARDVARQGLEVFGETEGYVVAPSGSCVDIVRHH